MNNNTPHKPRKSRHAKRHAAEQTEPFGFDELETRSQEFRNDRRLRGTQQANADWVAEPLDEWLSCLDAGNTDLGRETMAAFAVGMRETLSIRDALILSLVIDESRCPKSWLMEFAARPHLARTRTRMGELLTCAFEDEGMMPDKERCPCRHRYVARYRRSLTGAVLHTAIGRNRLHLMVAGRSASNGVRLAMPAAR